MQILYLYIRIYACMHLHYVAIMYAVQLVSYVYFYPLCIKGIYCTIIILCTSNTVSVKSLLLTKQTNTIEAIDVISLHVATVQLNSKLTLVCISLASTQNFCKITCEFVASA